MRITDYFVQYFNKALPFIKKYQQTIIIIAAILITYYFFGNNELVAINTSQETVRNKQLTKKKHDLPGNMPS